MRFFSYERLSLTSIIILTAGAAWIAVTAAFAAPTTDGEIRAPQSGFSAPDFTLLTSDDESITLSELRGKAVLVNLWASWCGPCRAEMPAMQRIYEEYENDGFVVLAVNATNQDNVTNALAFVQEHQLTFPILLDVTGEVSQMYQLRALPSSFFIRPDGVIEEVVIGGPMAEALLRVRVEQLLEETN
ncbi:MAG: TlpA family protein disulfide reductase [Chloroflexi bacterium]|nr:TlpA family protein disulfide reductase [Chloroflexota bacterium]